MLYVLSIAQLVLRWYYIKWVFIKEGTLHDTVFVSYFDQASRVMGLASNTCSCIEFALADALLVSKFEVNLPVIFNWTDNDRYGDASTFGIVHSASSHFRYSVSRK